MDPADTAPATSPPSPSPCINVCRIDAAGDLCVGCLRTLDEIVAWADAGAEEKRAILARVAQRRTQIK
jgi:predicted Fe-S protein YdhL (DUF1289 family)